MQKKPYIYMDNYVNCYNPAVSKHPASYTEGTDDGVSITSYTAGVVSSSSEHKDDAAHLQSCQ